MPELPEVETTRLGIMQHVIGRTVVSVLVHEPRLRWPVAPELAQMLTDNRIKLLDLHLVRHSALVLAGRVIMASAGA